MSSINTRKARLIQIINTLQSEGAMTQTKLRKLINLRASTASYLVNDLKDLGIVVDSGQTTQNDGPGKPGNLLQLNNDFAQFIGCYVEKNKINIYVAGLDGEILDHNIVVVKEYSKVEKAIINSIDSILKANSRIRGIGIAMKGIVLLDGTIRIKYGEREDESWRSTGFLQRLKEHFKNIPVIVENDANCSAMLYQYENREDKMNLLLYLLNKEPFGIGCSILINGEIVKGYEGSAGQFFQRGTKLEQLYKERGERDEFVEEFIRIILPHITASAYLLNPHKVVLSGSILNEISDIQMKGVKKLVEETDIPADLVFTRGNKELNPAKGAALIAMNDYIDSFIGKVGAR